MEKADDVDKPGYVLDVDKLLHDFEEAASLKFSVFKELWRKRSFSFIHEGNPKGLYSELYLQHLYAAVLANLRKDTPLFMRLGVLFTLYTLYGTQSHKPPILVYVSLDDLKDFRSLAEELTVREAYDGLFILKKMAMEKLFLYGAVSARKGRQTPVAPRGNDSVASSSYLEAARDRLLRDVFVNEHLSSNALRELELPDVRDMWQTYSDSMEQLFGSSFVTRGGGEGRSFGDELVDIAESYELMKSTTLAAATAAEASTKTPATPGQRGSTRD